MPLNSSHQNITQLSGGPNAAADAFVSVYHEQQHFGYRDQAGIIWDAWYDGSGSWNLQQINGGGRTNGPTAFAGPFIGVFHDQQHFAYLDRAGVIWDAWYDGSGSWNLQQIPLGGYLALIEHFPDSPPPFVSIWNDPTDTQQHFTYLDRERSISDAFWDSDPPLAQPHWNRQRLHNRPAWSSPFACVFGNQQHIGYLDDVGIIVDGWYDGDGGWHVQAITGGGEPEPDARTKGPEAFPGKHPVIWVDHTNTQQHFTYLGHDRAIYDAFWDSNHDSWNLQKLNSGGLTDGPAAWSSPHVCFWEPAGKQYFAYRDEIGHIWFLTYDGAAWEASHLESSWPGLPGPVSVRASGDVTVWVDHTGSQLHFTWLDTQWPWLDTQQWSLISTPDVATRSVATEARVRPGVIWDEWFWEG